MRILRNETYLVYAAVTKDEAQRSIRPYYENRVALSYFHVSWCITMHDRFYYEINYQIETFPVLCLENRPDNHLKGTSEV